MTTKSKTVSAEAPEASIAFDNQDILDRVLDLGRDIHSVGIIDVSPPAGMVGLPKSVPALKLQGEAPRLESVAAFFEPYRTAPARRKGVARVSTLASFIDLSKRHADEHSAIFASTAWPNPSLLTVLDYHTMEGAARFGEHRIHYPFPLTEEFKAWIGQNGKPMDQAEFASFIENRIADLASPEDVERTKFEVLFKTALANPSQMLELSRGLEIHVAGKVKNTFRKQSGETQLVFEEEHQNARGEPVVVPGLFMISVPAFVDGETVRILGRLRYRARDGSLKWFYDLYKWDVELRERVKGDLDFAQSETGLPAFEGAPES